MLDCDRQADVHRCHDGELEPDRRAELEAHLARCAACRGLLRELGGLSAILARAMPTPVPPEAMDRLREAILNRQERRALGVATWLTAAAAAVLLAAVLTRPAPTDRPWTGPARWETLAAAVRPEAIDDEEADLLATAQWMASDLATGKGW